MIALDVFRLYAAQTSSMYEQAYPITNTSVEFPNCLFHRKNHERQIS